MQTKIREPTRCANLTVCHYGPMFTCHVYYFYWVRAAFSQSTEVGLWSDGIHSYCSDKITRNYRHC